MLSRSSVSMRGSEYSSVNLSRGVVGNTHGGTFALPCSFIWSQLACATLCIWTCFGVFSHPLPSLRCPSLLLNRDRSLAAKSVGLCMYLCTYLCTSSVA